MVTIFFHNCNRLRQKLFLAQRLFLTSVINCIKTFDFMSIFSMLFNSGTRKNEKNDGCHSIVGKYIRLFPEIWDQRLVPTKIFSECVCKFEF
jgi:hypothetical protein